MKLPNLYKKTSTGAIQVWVVQSVGDTVIVEQGQVDGAMQEYKTLCTPKNVGKANETSPEEQAALEAEAKWKKQIKDGYSEDPLAPVTVWLPMKVNEYQKHKSKVIYPCHGTYKLNGVNGEFRLNTMEFLSRGGEDYPPPIPEAIEELKHLCESLGETSLNYEIYRHGEWLQDIQSAVKKPTGSMKHLHPQLDYYIFDTSSSGVEAKLRKLLLWKAILEGNYKYIKYPIAKTLRDEGELEDFKKESEEGDYEGLVISNNKGLYEYNTRSLDVFKYKTVKSEEFKILEWFTDKNNQPVFWCQSKGGKFKVKPKGTKAQREAIRLEADSWIGGYMTVEFEMFSKKGIPQKPISIGFREGKVINGEFTPTE